MWQGSLFAPALASNLPRTLILTRHHNHPSTHRQHGSEMEVRAEILEALHSAAAEVDEVSMQDDTKIVMEGKSWRGVGVAAVQGIGEGNREREVAYRIKEGGL